MTTVDANLEEVQERLEDFFEHLRAADDLTIANLAKFRSVPPESSGLEPATYTRLFSRALNDAYLGLEQLRDPNGLYALIDTGTTLVTQRIENSPALKSALQDSGTFAAEGSVRAYVLATALRCLAPDSLSEFAAAVLKIPITHSLDLEPSLESPAF